jgi:hypothetical protein
MKFLIYYQMQNHQDPFSSVTGSNRTLYIIFFFFNLFSKYIVLTSAQKDNYLIAI